MDNYISVCSQEAKHFSQSQAQLPIIEMLNQIENEDTVESGIG